MKTRKLGIFLSAVASLSLVSCNDFLDLEPTDSQSDELVWATQKNAQLAANYMYMWVGDLGQYWNIECLAGMTEGLTDQLKYSDMTYNSNCYIPNEIAYGGSVITPTYVEAYLGTWSRMYGQIARANEAIYKLRKFGKFDAAQMAEVEAEFRFFRAFCYFELAKKYGDVVLYDENMDAYTQNTPLTAEADVYEFIYQDLKFAGENLPTSTVPNGRLTSGAAYAFMSRAMLYAERWADAKDAAAKVCGGADAGFVSPMGYAFPSDLRTPFTEGGTGAILQYCYNLQAETHSFDNMYAPAGDKAAFGNNLTGGYATPTQEMVESFEYADGGFPDWSTWHAEGVTEEPPFAELEPRFQATILYNGATWKGRTIEPFKDGADGSATWMVDTKPEGKTVTGYYLRKLVDENHDYTTDTRSTSPWTAIRYAEVVLNYAEACAELGETSNALAAVNAIRTREAVGLPEVTGVSGESLMAAIRQERKVELAYEGQYYWDMRRWGLAETAFTGIRVHGLKVEKVGESFKYTYIECDNQNRNYAKKMNRFPIPLSELENNKSVTQFPEWN